MLQVGVEEDLEEGAAAVRRDLAAAREELFAGADLSQFAIRGGAEDWDAALGGKGGVPRSGLLSVKRKPQRDGGEAEAAPASSGKKKKQQRREEEEGGAAATPASGKKAKKHRKQSRGDDDE